MGYNAVVPSASAFKERQREHNALFSAIHRARVVEIHIDEGAITVSLESITYSRKITMPLLGLSAPPDYNSDVPAADFKASSWGRYIPQVGDLLYVGFDMNGTLYSLGYASVYYKGWNQADEDLESEGGIGFGEVSEKRMKPGDWDFKSARSSGLYLGGQAKLYSGANSITMNRDSGDIIVNTLLFRNQIGFSDFRFGSVRRLVLPTDTSESYIYTNRGATIAQEATMAVRWAGTPIGVDLAIFSIGDVVDNDYGAYSLKLSSATVPAPLRRYFSSNDLTGYIPTFKEEVDCVGNYLVTANLAVDFKWSTILADWDITNKSTSITSTTTIDLESLIMLTLKSLKINLGGSAVDSVIKGTTFIASLTSYLTSIASLYSQMSAASVGPLVPYAPSFTSLATLTTSFKNSLATTLSAKVFTE